MVQKFELVLRDSIWLTEIITPEVKEGYKITSEPLTATQPVGKRSWMNDGVCMRLMYMHGMNLQRYTRTTYTVLDLLRDAGGLFNAFYSIFSGLLSLLNLNAVY